MRKTYMDYMSNDSEGCPDCGSNNLTWMPASATEPGEYSCDSCNGLQDGIDTEYDDWKDREAEQS